MNTGKAMTGPYCISKGLTYPRTIASTRKYCPLAPSTLNPGLQDCCQSVSKVRNGLKMTGALGENSTTSLALHSGICKLLLACLPQAMSLSKGKCPTAVPIHFLVLLRQFIYLFSKCLWVAHLCQALFSRWKEKHEREGGPWEAIRQAYP